MRQRGGGDAGETLIEAVISTMILGIAVVAVVGAVLAGVSLAGEHRKLVVSDVTVKNVAESVESAPYAPGASSYSAVVPTGYTATATVLCVPAAAVTTLSTAALVACSVSDLGLQVVTVLVNANGGGASETTQFIKRAS